MPKFFVIWKVFQNASNNFMVNQRVSEWNTCKQDMTALYMQLVELGMEYHNGKVYLSDLENSEA